MFGGAAEEVSSVETANDYASHRRGRQPGDPKLLEQLGALHGISRRYLPLASPGGKLSR